MALHVKKSLSIPPRIMPLFQQAIGSSRKFSGICVEILAHAQSNMELNDKISNDWLSEVLAHKACTPPYPKEHRYTMTLPSPLVHQCLRDSVVLGDTDTLE